MPLEEYPKPGTNKVSISLSRQGSLGASTEPTRSSLTRWVHFTQGQDQRIEHTKRSLGWGTREDFCKPDIVL